MAFMLNLAVCDLLYCCITLPIYARQHISSKIGLDDLFCKVFAIFRNINVEADFMTIGMIAVSRLVRCFNGNVQSFLDKYSKSFVMGTWMYGIIIFLCRYLLVSLILEFFLPVI